MYNICIRSANLSISQDSKSMLLVLDISDNPKVPSEVNFLAVQIDYHMVGLVLLGLMNVLQVPSFNHIKQVPAVLSLEGNKWTLYNFIDENKKFNTEELVSTFTQLLTDSAATTNPSPAKE